MICLSCGVGNTGLTQSHKIALLTLGMFCNLNISRKKKRKIRMFADIFRTKIFSVKEKKMLYSYNKHKQSHTPKNN